MREPVHPERSCGRHETTQGGLIDHFCSVILGHPGPHAPKTIRAAVEARDAWEAANPGWEQLMQHDDPFAEIKP